MLRFDVPPVYSNVARVEAFITSIAFALGLWGFIWLIPVIGVQAFVRGFINPHKCLFHLGVEKILLKINKAGHKENAGAKMFAQKLLFIASSIVMVMHFMQSCFIVIPLTVILFFSMLEWALSFCVACWAYSIYYGLKDKFSSSVNGE